MAEQDVMEAPAYDGADDFNRGNNHSDDGAQDSGGSDNDGGGDGIAHGMGQSKSSRRRRRKRKNKVGGPVAAGDGEPGSGDSGGQGSDSSNDGGSGPVIVPMEGESISIAASAAPPQARRQSAPQGGQQGSGQQNSGQPQGAGGKRWKKKFRDRERRPRSENPGNDFRAEGSSNSSNGGAQGGYAQQNGGGNYGGGFKRKGKQQGGRRERAGFVGPMDHSYREANGNFADASASTISVNGTSRRGGRHHGDSQPIDHSMPRAVPIPENAQTHIYFFIEDLFITAKINETARKQGIKIAFIKNEKDALAALMEEKDTDKPALIVFDLNNVNAKPLTLIPKLKSKFKRSCSIIGFLSHLQGDLKAKAVEAGCDSVMPKAAFSQNLPNLLRRYGVEEEEEVNFNC